MTIILSGVAEFKAALDEIVVEANAASLAAVTTGAHLLEAEIKTALSRYSHALGTPTPSPRGDPPAVVSGTLRRSPRVSSPEPKGPTGWTISVGPTAIYSRIQELGGQTGRGGKTTLPPRPYVQPALEKVISDGSLADCYATAWRTAF